MPRERDRQSVGQQAEEPTRVEVGAWQSIHIPAAAEAADVQEARGNLAPEHGPRRLMPGRAGDPHVCQRRAQARGMSIGDHERREDGVGHRGAPDRAREREVGATHVVEVGWKICLGSRLLIGSGADFDHHLEGGVQSVDQPPKAVEPLLAVVLRRPGEADRSGVDNRRADATLGPPLPGVAAHDADQRLRVNRHRRSRGHRHRTRYVARENTSMSAAQPSTGRPRQRPHAAAAPIATRIRAAPARTGVGAHWPVQAEKPASNATTR